MKKSRDLSSQLRSVNQLYWCFLCSAFVQQSRFCWEVWPCALSRRTTGFNYFISEFKELEANLLCHDGTIEERFETRIAVHVRRGRGQCVASKAHCQVGKRYQVFRFRGTSYMQSYSKSVSIKFPALSRPSITRLHNFTRSGPAGRVKAACYCRKSISSSSIESCPTNFYHNHNRHHPSSNHSCNFE